MEFKKYKMIFTTKINKELKDKISNIHMGYIEQTIKDEMLSDYIRILGNNFVKNNKNKGKLIMNNKKYRLKELINNKDFNVDKIKINMILNKGISNISHMFKNCVKLLEISIKDSIINIDEESYEELFDYNIDYNEGSYKNSNNYEDNCEYIYNNFYKDYIYSNCSEITKCEEREVNYYNSTLTELKNNIKIYLHNLYSNLSEMFYNCLSLLSLPDISKWNTDNVIVMIFILFNCSSLLSLPDISKWNTDNLENMSSMFFYCSSLSSLPDISKWNTVNVINMNFMFFYCSSLSSFPDISKWNTDNVTDISFMFSDCSLLSSLPDISKWNTENTFDLSNMFSKCRLLLSLPEISK